MPIPDGGGQFLRENPGGTLGAQVAPAVCPLPEEADQGQEG